MLPFKDLPFYKPIIFHS